MTADGRIDYIEFPATDIAKTRSFYQGLFGWTFEDYGPDYTSFGDGRITGKPQIFFCDQRSRSPHLHIGAV